jgi:hypothetical protein
VKLQENVVIVEIDPVQPVLPSTIWKEIERVGFVPENMEIWAHGVIDGPSFSVDGKPWPLVRPRPSDSAHRRAHVRVLNGGEDPPQVEWVE